MQKAFPTWPSARWCPVRRSWRALCTHLFALPHSAEMIYRSVLSRWCLGRQPSRRGTSLPFLRIPKMFNYLPETMGLVSGRTRNQIPGFLSLCQQIATWKENLFPAQGGGGSPKTEEAGFPLISNFLWFLDSGYMLIAWQKLHNWTCESRHCQWTSRWL